MFFENDAKRVKHIERFHHSVSKLAAYNNPLSPKDKVSQLSRNLPSRFAPLVTVAKSSNVFFEKVTVFVKAEIRRGKIINMRKVDSRFEKSKIIGELECKDFR